MKTSELQNSIIQKVLHTEDNELLIFLNKLLSTGGRKTIYSLSEFEKNILAESNTDYLSGRTISDDDVFNQNEEWLNE